MITRDDWLHALADVVPVPQDDPEALTAAEFATLFRCQPTTARLRLKTLLTEGRVERCSKIVGGADGRQMRVPAYRLVPHAE